MWSRLWQKLQTTVFGGAVIISTTWVVSKLLGLLRERLIADKFGTSGADPIYAAFTIPDFLYGTLVLGSFLSAFMPVFIAYRLKDRQEAWAISRTILTILAIVFFGLGLLLLIGANPIIDLLVGDKFSAEVQAQSATLMRIMSMNMLLFAVSNVFAGVLQSIRRFLAVSMAPILNNFGAVFGLVVLVPIMGIYGVAWGAVVGAACHLLIQVMAAWRAGWRWGAMVPWGHPGVRKIGALLLPRTIGQSVTQIDQLVNVPIATRLGPSNLTIFRRANILQDFPLSIIGVSLATVAFPVFVELLSQNKKEEFIKHFSSIVRQILFLIIPISVLFLQLRAQFVRVIFGASGVSWPDTIATAQTLGFFALSFFAQSLIPILARSFYAMQDTKTPVKITTVAIGLDIIGSIILGFSMGVQGIALSFTISSIINASWLFLALHRRVGNLDEDRITRSVMRVIGITVLMALTVQATKYFLVSFGLDLTIAVGVLAQALIAGLVGLLAYLLFAVLFRLDEASIITNTIGKFWGGLRNNNQNPI